MACIVICFFVHFVGSLEIIYHKKIFSQIQLEDLNDQLSKLKDALKLSKNKENSLLDEVDDLNHELQKKVKAHTKFLREREEMEKENEELKKRIKRLTNAIQVNIF